jgi:RNA recognition motif-containing protein
LESHQLQRSALIGSLPQASASHGFSIKDFPFRTTASLITFSPSVPTGMTIYIGNLSFQAEQEDLLDLFSQYGEVKSASLPLDRETGRKRGFAFVEMNNDSDEQKAIDDLQNVEWMGRMIRVNKATPRERNGGGGGGGGGGNRGGGGGGGYGGGNRW